MMKLGSGGAAKSPVYKGRGNNIYTAKPKGKTNTFLATCETVIDHLHTI